MTELVKLATVTETIMGQAPSSHDCNKDGTGTPFVKAGEFGLSRPVIKEWTTNPLKFAKYDDVLLCVVGATCGKINKGFDGAIGRSVAAVRAKPEFIDKDYLYYFLQTWSLRLRAMSQGAAQTVITRDMIGNLEIYLPPLEEQRRIASILDQADELRQKRQQAIEKLDQLLQATFIDMFGDPVSNPKGWEVKKLSELSIKIHSGNTPKGGSENYVDQGIIFLRSQNVWKNKVILDDVAYIDAETHSKMMKSSVKHEDLLMTKTGRINTENSSLGRAAIYLGEDDSANINGHVYLIRIKDGFNKYFILRILTLPDYYEYIRSVCVGGIDKRQLNKEHIENFPIIQPPMELQNKFSNIVQVIESQKPKLLEQLDLAENLFKTLQQKAFNGTL
ncbi:restriction endonuclease subunit S [Acinetobacter baumannii]|uniref:restriction endonuclease subunit S n=1 Tax=Acinetobacter TaxID=469 RepID=UPI00042105D0|nr:restriction endonuclease subunit S [Acinetobacter baumannii]WEH88509.1 restriction endonuclease subunit S [Acinetobacter soli]APJ17651.1 type I restriction endonuclease subunit R [Acinetobacter baumannii]EKW7508004.1 restriction endonuclease subunit S [Acinetobacter baumannii]EKX8119060.1 restriction endonuclease subunit S [Acinetobacter baumannii]MBD0137298.1 restriction endonuclease subunit S [Acinetobacter baumannii]